MENIHPWVHVDQIFCVFKEIWTQKMQSWPRPGFTFWMKEKWFHFLEGTKMVWPFLRKEKGFLFLGEGEMVSKLVVCASSSESWWAHTLFCFHFHFFLTDFLPILLFWDIKRKRNVERVGGVCLQFWILMGSYIRSYKGKIALEADKGDARPNCL